MVTRRGWVIASVLVVALLLAACETSAAEAGARIKERVDTISVEDVMADLRDCDKLSETFVGLVQTGADAIDELAETTEGRVPETEVRNVVDKIATNEFFEIAERIGCDRLQSKIAIVDQLRGVDAESPEGTDFLNEILRQVERQ